MRVDLDALVAPDFPDTPASWRDDALAAFLPAAQVLNRTFPGEIGVGCQGRRISRSFE